MRSHARQTEVLQRAQNTTAGDMPQFSVTPQNNIKGTTLNEKGKLQTTDGNIIGTRNGYGCPRNGSAAVRLHVCLPMKRCCGFVFKKFQKKKKYQPVRVNEETITARAKIAVAVVAVNNGKSTLAVITDH
jgi:hypothetical protein